MNRLQLARSRYRVRATEDTVEEWKSLHSEAMKVRDYETIVSECLQMASLLHGVVLEFTKEFLTGGPDSLDLNERLKFVEISERGAAIFQGVVRDGAFINRDYKVDNFAEAQACLVKLQKANARLRMTCPEANLAFIDAAREDVKQGNSLSFEEAFPDALPVARA